MTASVFAQALESGVELLRSLPRRRSAVPAARAAARDWAARHPGVGAQLVVDERPGTPVVDYDLLFDHPGGGTVAVTAPAEDGVPWLVDHSTHWAAGHLVSVDGVHVSVSQALTMLRTLSKGGGSPYQEIVDQCLLAAALEEAGDDATPPTAAELQATADEFRRGRGLHDRAATLAWMTAAGLSGEQFESYIGAIARRRRFRLGKEAELAPAYLAAHLADFARVRAVWVTGPERVVAGTPGELLGGAAAHGEAAYGEAVVTVGTRWEHELPEMLRGAAAGDVVGPASAPGGGFLTGAVLSRTEAVADAGTLAEAGRAAFGAWLAERRAAAEVEWHRS
ncbi:TIGR04500 family putative peptide maturation system protein [Actinomadura sp. ATCC 31491]|uniref:TIGR04500 family putative peptide maturation system protein n=1 Tax=Actinomadura luzonensis TaxID=2805427 RepID=A0ABT0G433_9ACTN|nr:TIGR04500 family putative peptide maturation system protein [Actinomadura luzonensis]MCK2219350.1 TIGR04500 family putative peptide maturation system protein [Actinomadura luzonensis]